MCQPARAKVNKTGGTEENTKARLKKEVTAYAKLDKIWKNSQFTSKTKIVIIKGDVISVFFSHGLGAKHRERFKWTRRSKMLSYLRS